jgi:uncharacterized damage-inducible protein DinB
MSIPDSHAGLFLERSRYFLGVEYPSKLKLAVMALPADKFWWRPDEHSNSAGNLLLHLNGNARQWLLGGIGRRTGSRDRAGEFAARVGPPAQALLSDLENTLAEVDQILAALTPRELLEPRMIQGRDITVLEAIYHVVEHFSMHLGQIVLLAKLHAPGAIGFYEDAGGLAHPVWQDKAR